MLNALGVLIGAHLARKQDKAVMEIHSDAVERLMRQRQREERLNALEEHREAGRVKHIRLKRVGKEMVTWSLGLGPCGRTVTALQVTRNEQGVTIEQLCTDHPVADTFFYPIHTVEALAVYTTNKPEVACQVPSPD